MEHASTQARQGPGWIAGLQAWLRAGAAARRERAIRTWGDGASPDACGAGPDRMYRSVRAAWGPRR